MNSGTKKMDLNPTGLWVTFFTAAGIPSEVAATYALTFTENRIQNDMLLDLNKEYLRDMGIVRMGDIIAILRHAKQVHENTARDKVLSTTNVANKVPVATVAGRSTVSQPSSPTRMLEHYTRNCDPAPIAVVQNKRKSDEFAPQESAVNNKKARLIRFANPPKALATLPIKLVLASPSKTVFARLGSSDPKPEQTQKETKQVFARLGSKNAITEPIPKDALKYEGILKSPPVAKRTFTVTTNKNNTRTCVGTMRADETPVSAKEKLTLSGAKSVKFSNRVEYKEIENVQKPPVKFTSVFNKPERRLSMPVTNTVKARLGVKKDKITNSLFNRLGAGFI
ncbi:uncharacterized protein C19orf47 isoform X2 [Pieris brassicae]|uniref:uncharacterized protein C19orf47 isoform X2 n=1 Tax=Pieris brassicae TaxID=7116 RepID=UPI001E661313|nr:uncharacterized protein C19orf47 isoform X2 [Pieris brassicae]